MAMTEKNRESTIWDEMSEKDLMTNYDTIELDQWGVPKVPGYYDGEGQRLDGKTLEPYDAPNKGLLKTWYNKMMPFDSFDFEDIYRQPAFGKEGYIMNGRATNYPVTRTFDDGYGMGGMSTIRN